MTERKCCPICKAVPSIVCGGTKETGVLFGLECRNPDCTAKAAPIYYPSVYDAVKAWNDRIDA